MYKPNAIGVGPDVARSGRPCYGVLASALMLVLVTGCNRKHEEATTVSPPSKTATSAPAAPADGPTLTLDLGDGVKLELVRVPAGAFMMGSPDDEPGHDSSESPVHKVEFKKPFYIGKYEVTQAQFVKLCDPGHNKKFKFTGSELPCEEVNWDEGKWFCDNASAATGRTVRLPSEAEWEYAARGGTSTPYFTGAEVTTDQANFSQGQVGTPGESVKTGTTKVGSFKPNAFGVCDTAGNVAEWVQDVWHDDYKGAPVDGSAWLTGGAGDKRVYRGGAYSSAEQDCRPAVRMASAEPKEDRVDTRGFRVVVEAK
jgi:formylglycine-generating enzyme required for sulfatase activity